MRIRAFSKNVEEHELQDYHLKNCSVVIDGQNYFYNFYQKSGLPYAFGCEADKYAKYLRNHLAMFINSNVKCYVVLKGGHENINKALNVEKITNRRTLYNPFEEYNEEITMPVFMKTVYRDVLYELGISTVICEFESKQQCIALAQKLKCPIISYDIEFCFSGVPYIPSSTMCYEESKNQIDCRIFDYDRFKSKHDLNDEKVAIFIALTDEKRFPDDTFEILFRTLRLPLGAFKRNFAILQWLSRTSHQAIYKTIYRHLNTQYKHEFQDEIDKITNFICRIETPGIPVEYLLNNNDIVVHKKDPKWFEKGLALQNISIHYVNLYHFNAMHGSWSIEDMDADDAMLLSWDIIAYAFNLLTNYKRDEITFVEAAPKIHEIKDISLSNPAVICKPPYEAEDSPFENGWDEIKSLHLFEHFMTRSLQCLNFGVLDSLPEDARLLVLALVYFSRHKGDGTDREVYSILLSYVMLNVVFEKVDKNNNGVLQQKPIKDTITDKNLVQRADCNAANVILNRFFELPPSELGSIFDRKLLHSLVEFQYCLDELNCLNKLCGAPFRPTLIHKTYNGTFVYKFFYSMKEMSAEEAMSYIEYKLSPASTVLALFKGLLNVYKELMH